jgi:hypothetical protein
VNLSRTECYPSCRNSFHRTRIALMALLVFLTLSGCARQSPSRNTLSGRRLLVTMRFRQPINPFYSYFFLINNVGNQNAPGPVAVYVFPYGNGFATGSGGGQIGFTDFVRFDDQQPQGYGVYHVLRDANNNESYIYKGSPVRSTPPSNDPTDPSANELRFELDLSQIITDANGNPLPDPAEAANLARLIKHLQVNIVATSTVPGSASGPVDKLTDAFGDTTGSGIDSFLRMDATQLGRVLRSNDFIEVAEPTTPDVFGGDDGALDLVEWTIEVRDFSS